MIYLAEPHVNIEVIDRLYTAQELPKLIKKLQEVFGTRDIDIKLTLSGHNTELHEIERRVKRNENSDN